uniref:Histone-lysine N-methyltransferase SETD7 n=1 Tax=Eptatretus burgeri TaxID=7764 RepID=A0A8C4R5A3_EPTBU
MKIRKKKKSSARLIESSSWRRVRGEGIGWLNTRGFAECFRRWMGDQFAHMDSEDEDDVELEETVDGPLDEDKLPHGFCKITYSSGDRFEGFFVRGEKQGKGKFYFFDGSTLHGNFVDDALQGKAFYTNEDGSTIHGTYSDGQLHGYAEEHDPDGRLTFSGHYQNNVRCGLCWIYFPDGGKLIGHVNDEGEMTGGHVGYVYPDDHTALYGEFVDAEMVSAHPASFHGVEDGKSHFKILKDGPELSFDRSTSTCISSKPLVPDPYEKKRVYVGPSLIPGAGEGLFALSAMEGGTVMAFYNGVRLTHEEVDGRDWSLNENTISLDEETVIDVPKDKSTTSLYCASLGHKANHSFMPNSKYDIFLSCCMTHFLLSFSSRTDAVTFSCIIFGSNPEFMVLSMMVSWPCPEGG